ncbi:MAG: restriction endonuclease [Erythrobacter sp.]
MVAGPAAALELIEGYVSLLSPPKSARDILEEIIIDQQWRLGDEAKEFAERWANSFIFRARTQLNAAIEQGEFQAYSFNSANADYIQGSCFIEPHDSPEIRNAKIRRSNCLQLYEAVKSRTADDLEILCKKMLTLLGVKDPEGTPRSGDGGVDFYGYSDFGFILKEEILPAGAEKNMRVWFVGQAKHYTKTHVSTKDVREIVGSVELARAKLFANSEDPMKKFQAKLCDPVFSIFVTTGRFSRDSRSLMAKSGIVAMDGPQLGQFLADNGVGLVNDNFCAESFNAWIASC